MAMLDLNTIGQALTSQEQIAENRRVAELNLAVKQKDLGAAARQKAEVINTQSMQAAQKTRDSQLELMGGLDEQVQIAQRAMKLSDSDNPLDRLELWVMQQTNKSYTREGNLERLNYLNTAQSALGQRGLIEQQGFADLLSQVNSDLNNALATDQDKLGILSLQEKQGNERIDAAVAYQQARLGILQSNSAMQELTLSNMDATQVDNALMTAQNTDSGQVNIGGIDFSAAKIQERKDQLGERAYLTQVHANGMADALLSNMDSTQLQEAMVMAQNNDGFLDVKGTKISTARIQDAMMLRTTNTAQLHNMNQNLQAETDKRIAQTMNVVELNKAITDGGTMANGYQFASLDVLKQTRDLKMESGQQGIQQEMIMGQIKDPLTQVVQHRQYIDSIRANVPAGSPLLKLLDNEQTMGTLASNLMGTDDPQRTANGLQAIAASQENIRNGIAAEAKRLGGGDSFREEAWSYRLQGQAIPERVVIDALTKAKGNPSVDWMTPAVGAEFKTLYQQQMNQIMLDEQRTGGNMSQQEKQAAATTAALEGVKGKMADGMTTEFFGFQSQDPALQNPVTQSFRPGEFMEVMRAADMEGARLYAANSGSTKEQMADFLERGVPNPDLARAQTAALLVALDKKKPGLAKEYIEWWDSDKRQQAGAKFIEAKNATAGNSLARASELSMVLPGLQDDLGTYANLLNGAYTDVYSEEMKRQHSDYINFGSDPVAKQVFLLGIDGGLTDVQKQQAMQQIILPLVTQAQNNQYDATQTAAYVDSQLASMRPQDASTRNLLAQIMKGREASLGTADKFASSQQLWNDKFDPLTQLIGRTLLGGDAVTRRVKGFEWWTSITPGK